jgi:predicted glycosyltransferase
LGKHRELLPALATAANTKWILGVRGVVGAVPQVFSEQARSTFKRYFSNILWYGDETVLGMSALDELYKCFACKPYPCGYVSRLVELGLSERGLFNSTSCSTSCRSDKPAGASDITSSLDAPIAIQQNKKYAGTISIPWQGEHTPKVIHNLAVALQSIGPEFGKWKIFLGREDGENGDKQENELRKLPHVSLEQPGREYGKALAASKIALIYGGYNSITDVLSLNIPAVVLLRSLKDKEQEQHLQQLQQKTGDQLCVIPEQLATAERLEQLMLNQLSLKLQNTSVNLAGASSAARQLASEVLNYKDLPPF